MPPAPGRFSTMMVWPSSRPSGSAIRRASVSPPPPAAKGTTRVMAWVGQAGSAWAVQNASDAQAAATVPIKLL